MYVWCLNSIKPLELNNKNKNLKNRNIQAKKNENRDCTELSCNGQGKRRVKVECHFTPPIYNVNTNNAGISITQLPSTLAALLLTNYYNNLKKYLKIQMSSVLKKKPMV